MKLIHEFYSDEEAQAYFLREIAVQLVELNEYLHQKRVAVQEEFETNQKMLENFCNPITKQALDLMQEIKEEQERASGVQDLQKVEKEDDSCLCNGVGCNHCAGQGSY